ncbi:MAG: hypothetical protein J0L84_07710 [Verrucomicrobia bacterium]|nr:hypothetical protein [Verrucomicrobiota bacterium]
MTPHPARISGLLVLVLVLTAIAVWGGPSVGGDFSLEGSLTSGTGSSAGGDFALETEVSDTADVALRGGDFEVSGILVGVAVVPGEVALNLTVTGDLATLTWPAEAADYVLEFADGIAGVADWQPVTPAPVGTVHTTPFNQPLRFFRLRRP